MNKKIALILACCAATSFAACNETTEWNFTESCDAEAKRCVESTIQVCKDGVWVLEATCEGNTPWCDVATHTCIAQPVVKDCQDGAKKCDQNAVWACKTGKWEKTTDCNEGDKTCNSTTYVCDPKAQTEVTCDHNGTKLAVDATVCSDDTTLQTCTLNADGTTASLTPTDCSTYSKVCGNDAENKAACIDAQPAPSVKCTKDGDETEYKVGDKYCGDNNTLYTCTLSEDGTTATFESAACQGDKPVCDNTANECRAYNNCTLNNAPVAHNATVCDGNVSKKCNDGTLEIVEDCIPAQVCLASTGACGVAPVTSCTDTAVGTVEDGKTVCKENNVYTCNNTQLSKTTDCTVTDAESAAHLVSVCTPGEQGANATCVKKCAEDYKFGEGANANKCVAAHDQQCKINTVADKQVAQYRTAESEGGYTDWNNCAKDDFSIYGCKENKECELTGCADTHEIATIDGEKVCVKKKVNNCGNDVDGNKAETDSAYCVSDTQYAICQGDGQNVYTSTEPITCSATYKCINSKANELNGCACTATTAPACTIKASGAYISTCNPETGKLVDEKCPMPDNAKSTVCSADKCDFECKTGLIKNQAGTDCVECTDPTATKCPDKRYCSANGKCTPLGTTACTADVCKNGFINYCKGDDGAKKYADAVSCIENGVGICAEGGTACTTDVKSCNVNYIKVDNACKKYDTVECTKGVCTDSHYFGCPAVTDGTSYHTKGVEKPAVDANGTWACDVDNGWTLTCNKVDNVEVYEVTESEGKKSCILRAGMCTADADCTDATKTKCNTTTKVCEASATPAPECSGDAIQCVSDAKYKTCTGDKWGAETDVATGLKCDMTDATAHKLICASDAPKTCDGTKVMGCKDGKLSQEIEDCATNTADGKTTCSAGECVAGGATPAPTKSLIISELIRIGNNGRAIELYNATDSAIDLSKCKVEILASGNDTVDITIDNMTGSIESGHVHVICGNKVETTYTSAKGKCNTTANDNLQNMGKKRVVRLSCNGMDVDVLGKLKTSDSFFSEQRNIRKCGIIVGDTNGTDAWDVNTQFESTKLNDNWNWDSIGTHKAVCDTPTE
ncbi:MAG: lamin tail domain-containing protein [Bradymonadales bacterium]|nr:lamin tail domain-containing protein [Bradymonadales bacterium]